MTKALAIDLGRNESRIRVNSVHPGGIDTVLARNRLKACVDAGVVPSMDAAEHMLLMLTPLGRVGHTDDVSGAVVFMASDASKFMTG